MATATLMLSRKWGGIDTRTWQIIIDGNTAGEIGKQQTVELPVGPGRHTLRLRSSQRFVSPERSFEATGGQVIRFSCRAAMFWPRMLAALVKHDLWIALNPD